MPESNRQLRGYALVLIAACLWATIGLFYRALKHEFGLTEGVIVAYRVGIPAIVLFTVLGLTRPRLLHVRRRDWPYFAMFGSVGVAAFYLVYVEAAIRGPLAIASVLLYTAPIWITIWGVVRGDDRLDRSKSVALALAVGGCALVANIFDRANLLVNGAALLFGVLSGLGYAAYSLWSASGTRRGYNAWTVVAYSLGIGALVLFASQPLAASLHPFSQPASWPYLLGVGLGPTLLAPVCFTLGLRDVPTSNASILATVEPVMAALLGWLVVVPPEPLSPLQLLGGAAVLAAVVVLARRSSRAARVAASRSASGATTP